MSQTTPLELGYRMPPEWAPHQATWLSWPHKKATWPGKFEPVPPVFAQFAAALTRSEPVHINVTGEAMATDVTALMKQAGAREDLYTLHPIPTNDAWCRDHGAIFVTKPRGRQAELAAVQWGFNAWGGKYKPWNLDSQIARLMARDLGVALFEGGMILEGGSIDINGAGLLLTTEQCLLNPNRNPNLDRTGIEARLKAYLGVEKVLWLGAGLEGDDTDGHVDDITRFVNANTVVTAVEADPADVNYRALKDNLARLQKMTGLDGKPLNVIELPMPGPVEFKGQRLPASYANFYIANRIVVLPTYRHANDEVAAEILRGLFPEREIVPIDSWDLILGRGSFHCLSQQVPATDNV